MNISQAITAWASDDRVIAATVIVALDLGLGVAAAAKAKTFRLSYISDYARTDILGKLLPWAALYVAWKLTGNSWLSTVEVAVYALAIAAWTGSLLKSLRDLGMPISVPALTGPERPPPPPLPEPSPPAKGPPSR